MSQDDNSVSAHARRAIRAWPGPVARPEPRTRAAARRPGAYRASPASTSCRTTPCRSRARAARRCAAAAPTPTTMPKSSARCWKATASRCSTSPASWAWGCLSLEGPVGYVRARPAGVREAEHDAHASSSTARPAPPGSRSPTGWQGASEFELVRARRCRAQGSERRAREALNCADFAILCLPDDAAREAVAHDRRRQRHAGDRRLHRPPRGARAGSTAFPNSSGRKAVAGAARVSNPGCYPTGFIALVAPLVRAGLLPARLALHLNAVSGYSGGGKALIAAVRGAKRRHRLSRLWPGAGSQALPRCSSTCGLEHRAGLLARRRARPIAAWWSRCRCRSRAMRKALAARRRAARVPGRVLCRQLRIVTVHGEEQTRRRAAAAQVDAAPSDRLDLYRLRRRRRLTGAAGRGARQSRQGRQRRGGADPQPDGRPATRRRVCASSSPAARFLGSRLPSNSVKPCPASV